MAYLRPLNIPLQELEGGLHSFSYRLVHRKSAKYDMASSHCNMAQREHVIFFDGLNDFSLMIQLAKNRSL